MSTPSTVDARQLARQKMARKAGYASLAGTTIEWYDFYAYGTASALVFPQLFFPAQDRAMGTLAAFATFWVGFLARPIGGMIFGHFGDKVGRKKALITTLMMMGTCTTAVGLLPTYQQVGAIATITLVVLRLVQGIAMGGEWGGAVVLAAEHAPKGKGIIYGAFAQQGSPLGNLLSTTLWLVLARLPDEQFVSWGWRIPFLISAVLVGIGLFIRLSIEESPAMKELMVTKPKRKAPLGEVLRGHKGIVALGIGACIIAVSATYFKGTFALAWAVNSGLFTRSEFLSIVTVSLIVQFCIQPFGAIIASKIKLKHAVVLLLGPEFILMPLMFYLISTGNYAVAMIGMSLATMPHSMYYAALAGILAKSFPPQIRYTGISLSYQLSSTVFAGTAPMVGQWLLNTTGSIVSVITLAVIHVALTLSSVLVLLARSEHFVHSYSGADSFSSRPEEEPAVPVGAAVGTIGSGADTDGIRPGSA